MKENIHKTRVRVLEKLINNGYNNDKKICELKLEEIIMNDSFNRTELEIIVRIKQSLINKNLISFISGNDKEEK